MNYLDLEDLLHIADRVLEGNVLVRDGGLLASAAARPHVTVFGQDAYPTVHDKAAAIAFLGLNGQQLTLSNDAAYDLVMAVATGSLTEVADISAVVATGTRAARPR